jgi:uncharacterized repeat protein (TIGR03943 family)
VKLRTMARPLLAFVFGVTAIRLALTGQHRQFVRAGLGPFLVVSGIVLCGLALFTLFARPVTDEHLDHHHDDTSHSVGPGWLLLLPVIALFVVAPPPLGSWGLGQVGSSSRSEQNWAPLPDSASPVSLRLRELVGRASGAPKTLSGRVFVLEGFVSRTGSPFAIARYSISCCAADAQGAEVIVEGVPSTAAVDSWVRVTAAYQEMRNDAVVVRATSIELVPSPGEPFE